VDSSTSIDEKARVIDPPSPWVAIVLPDGNLNQQELACLARNH
jgi:hypothetical protein